MTARPEGCGVVPVASNQRDMDSRIYSAAQCVGQLAENAAAKGTDFNATTFDVAIMTQFETSLRAPGTDIGVPSHSQAVKVLDNGKGFLYEEVEDTLTYGTPTTVSTEKKFGGRDGLCDKRDHQSRLSYLMPPCAAGRNNHNLKSSMLFTVLQGKKIRWYIIVCSCF